MRPRPAPAPLSPRVAWVLVLLAQSGLLALGWYVSVLFGRLGEHSPLYRVGPAVAGAMAALALGRLTGFTYLMAALFSRPASPQRPGGP